MSTAEEMDRIEQLLEDIRKLLVGNLPEIQEFVLAGLMGQWLSGWPDQLRARKREEIVHLMDHLTKVHVRGRHGDAGHPYDTGGATRQ